MRMIDDGLRMKRMTGFGVLVVKAGVQWVEVWLVVWKWVDAGGRALLARKSF